MASSSHGAEILAPSSEECGILVGAQPGSTGGWIRADAWVDNMGLGGDAPLDKIAAGHFVSARSGNEIGTP
jgi:hypothetical protein